MNPAKQPFTVFLVDDETVFLTAAKAYIEKNCAFDVEVHCFETGVQAKEELDKQPNVMVLDMFLGDHHWYNLGIQMVEEIKQESPHTHILMLTVFDNAEIRMKAIQLGAAAYLIKDSNQLANLTEAITSLYNETQSDIRPT